MSSQFDLDTTLNLADIYRNVNYVIEEKTPFIDYYKDYKFDPTLTESKLKHYDIEDSQLKEKLGALKEDINRLDEVLALLRLSLAHLFDTVSKKPTNSDLSNQSQVRINPSLREPSRLPLSVVRSLTGKRQLYYENSITYHRLLQWKLKLSKKYHELSKSVESPTVNYYLPVSLQTPIKVSKDEYDDTYNIHERFETNLKAIPKSHLSDIISKLAPPRTVTINLKSPVRVENVNKSQPTSVKTNEMGSSSQQAMSGTYSKSLKHIKKEPISSDSVVIVDSGEPPSPEQSKNAFISANTYLKNMTSKRAAPDTNGIQNYKPSKKPALEDEVNKSFINPTRKKKTEESKSTKKDNGIKSNGKKKPLYSDDDDFEDLGDIRLKNIEPQMIERIKNEIMVNTENLTMDNIAGLEHAKKMVREITILPLQRPDLFTGLRRPPKGVLLFGPPGTGKTLIGKCIASSGGATFFSISSSSLTSKWIGDGEKMVRALFAVARCYQPAVVFVDEIDSLLTQRTDSEVEASRRIKTEFLVQFDGCSSVAEDRILIIGATNRPQEIDEAARRRFMKRVYIPLPELEGRRKIVSNLLSKNHHDLSPAEFDKIAELTEGYSGSDMDGLCREAALGPIRNIIDFDSISHDDIRPISFNDFLDALKQVRASVDPKELDFYSEWNSKFGTLS